MPLKYIDPDGKWFQEFFSGKQSWSSFQGEIGEAALYMGPGWQTAMDHPIAAGAAVGMGAGAVAYGAAAGLTAASIQYLGGAGTTCMALCGKAGEVANTVSQTSQAVSAPAQKVTDIVKGFNHDGSYHGLNQVIERGVSPQMIKDTILNPLGTFAQNNGNTKYVSEQAMIIMNKAGQMVTAWTSNQFTQKSTDLVKSLLQK